MKRKVALLLAGIMGTSAVLGMGGCGNKGTEELVKKKGTDISRYRKHIRRKDKTGIFKKRNRA